MHNGNYDPEDPRCIEHKSLIETLEGYRKNFESRANSQFYSRKDEIRNAIDTIYIFFKREIGYAPAWLVNELDVALDSAGRSVKYDPDTCLFNCVFIDHMVMRGSSPTQAIKLLEKLQGSKANSTGFLKEMRKAYKEYKADGWDQDRDDPAKIGWIVAKMLNFDLSAELKSEEAAFAQALGAFKLFWSDVIDLMKEHHTVIAENDKSYPEIFGPVIEWLDREYEDSLEYFYSSSYKYDARSIYERRNGLREYLNSVRFFRDIWNGSETVSPPPKISFEDLLTTVEKN